MKKRTEPENNDSDSMDEFERRLKNQPWRPLPVDWRSGILAAAQATQNRDARSPRQQAIGGFLREWLWPSPLAWAGLAALWMMILLLDQATLRQARESMANVTLLEPRMVAALWKQQQQIQNLLEPDSTSREPAKSPKPAPDRSQFPAPQVPIG